MNASPEAFFFALFRLNAGEDNSLRIIRTGGILPDDRESLFWLNIKAIPRLPEEAPAGLLQIVVKTRLKLFYRPAALLTPAGQSAWRQLQFSRAGGQTPGIYRVDVWVNDMLKGRQDVTFIALKDQTLSPLFTPAEWQTLGLKTGSIAALRDWPAQKPVEDFATLMSGVVVHFDFSHQKLLITLPQELLDTLARGAVSPELWDEGAPALLLNYNLSGASTWQNTGGSDQNQFLALFSGKLWAACSTAPAMPQSWD
ncbi:FimD/PapC N-terminal domain-containing protein [Rahnella perminowiae]|uniref:FimD/PapC N-terminal domain-containing protein n=1 Tax=Rahnella perminowiae TaxID=2816244 RepID=UPI003651F7F2